MLPFPCLDRNAAAARQCRKKNQKKPKRDPFFQTPFSFLSLHPNGFFSPQSHTFPLDDLLLFIVRRAEGEKKKDRPTHLSMGGWVLKVERGGERERGFKPNQGRDSPLVNTARSGTTVFSISRNKRESDEGIYFTCHTQIEAG